MNQFSHLSIFPRHAGESTPPSQIQYDVCLSAFNSFAIVAKAHAYLEIHSLADFALMHRWQADPANAGLPVFVLGGGSNTLLSKDFPGLIVHMRASGMRKVGEDQDAVYLRAAGGTGWHQFVQWTLQQGWGGLENMSLIPGTVGAAPIQNIGAYGVEMKDYFYSASVYDRETQQIVELDHAACAFGYRDSVFKHAWAQRGIVLEVGFRLPRRWQAQLGYADVAQYLQQANMAELKPSQVAEAIIAIRQSKLPDPALIGNAGSFFKNPVVSAAQQAALLSQHPKLISYIQPDGGYKLAAGWLIEQTGWKGKSLGRAGVYEKQALVLVNRGQATGPDVCALAERIQQDVLQQFGVQLEIEPNVV